MPFAAPAIRIESLHVADFVHPEGGAVSGAKGVVMAYAIVHPDGVVLFDTGIGLGDPDIAAAYHPTARPIAALLLSRGIAPDAVVAIATSHLHFDHCGQNLAFPGVPIHVQAAEHAAAHEPDYTIPAWVDYPGARYELHDGSADILSGIRVLPTPGHTAGHQSLLVDTVEGPTLLVGQAVYSAEEWNGTDDPAVSGLPSAPDSAAYRVSRLAVHALGPRSVLFGHDLAVVRC
jgi:N-acyl homoserine lactone hydrolase